MSNVYENILVPGGCLSLPRGYIHVYDVYDHNIHNLLPRNRLANKSQTLCGAL